MIRTTLTARILKEASKRGLKYVLLRNYDFLLQNTPSPHKDVDIMISREDEIAMERILLEHDFTRKAPPGARWIVGYRLFPDGADRPLFVDIHLGGISCRGIYYLSAKEVLSKAVSLGPFTVLGPTHTWINFLVHSIICIRYFRPRYISRMKELERSGQLDWSEITIVLSLTFGKGAARRLLTGARNGEWGTMVRYRWPLIFTAALRSWGHARATVAITWRMLQARLGLNRSKRTRLIALMGVDGAGKTTLAEGLKSALEKNQRKCNIVYMGRGRERVMPGGRDIARGVGVNLPTGEEVSGGNGIGHRVLRTARDLMYLLDAYARYIRYLQPRHRRREVIITDRYAYDLLLNERTAQWVRWALLHFYPAPDLLFYLQHEPEVLHERKPQYTPERLARDMEKLEQMVHWVEGLGRSEVLRLIPQDPETTLNEALRHVL